MSNQEPRPTEPAPRDSTPAKRRRLRRGLWVLLGIIALVIVGIAVSNGGPNNTGAAAKGPAAAPASSAAAAAAAVSASPASTCSLADDQDVIVRYIVPGLQDSAEELGETDASHCTLTIDSLKTTAANGTGDCTQVAWAHDNPGYDTEAVPAPALKKVIESVGPGC